MQIEQRKIELINWITELESESLIEKVEALKDGPVSQPPDEIMDLLDASNKVVQSNLIKHTTSREILNS